MAAQPEQRRFAFDVPEIMMLQPLGELTHYLVGPLGRVGQSAHVDAAFDELVNEVRAG